MKNKGPKPSGVFKRVGSSTRNANEDEILMMIMQSHNYIYEGESAEEQDLSFKQFERILSNNEISLNARLYKTLGLKNSEGKYTNLGYIMSDQSPVAVKFAEYDAQPVYRTGFRHVYDIAAVCAQEFRAWQIVLKFLHVHE